MAYFKVWRGDLQKPGFFRVFFGLNYKPGDQAYSSGHLVHNNTVT